MNNIVDFYSRIVWNILEKSVIILGSSIEFYTLSAFRNTLEYYTIQPHIVEYSISENTNIHKSIPELKRILDITEYSKIF